MSSLSRAISNQNNKRERLFLEAIAGSFLALPLNFDFGGRSYVFSGSINHPPSVQLGVQVHEQTAQFANIGVTDDNDSFSDTDPEEPSLKPSSSHPIAIDSKIDSSSSSRSEWNRRNTNTNTNTNINDSSINASSDDVVNSDTPLLSSQNQYKAYMELQPWNNHGNSPDSSFRNPFDIEAIQTTNETPTPSSLHALLMKPIKFLPAVFLGTLLNILDGLSYGMIMFPLSEAVFSKLAPSGLSMFYLSTIVSQLVFSLGGSAFKAGIGSEMIEVTPFFHSMALSIASDLKNDDAILATTIVTFAISSMVTGLTFYILGKCRLGSLVGFFPRHILVGCIGGVGYFLVVTAIEVSSRLEGGFFYNGETLSYLLQPVVLYEWTFPLLLAAILIALEHRIHNSLLVPGYFILVFIIFHCAIWLVPSWLLEKARDLGFVFPAVEDDEPWYEFYTLYKFQVVDWWCIVKQIPVMLALTFFGILHVPINVPALAVSVGMDEFDVDRELVAHGYSNFILGMIGLIQNYLVYTNSVLFVRAGADDRLAGILLAAATAAVMIAGPVVIGYIPVCVVGALIYLLGYELLKEALFDTWGRLRNIEYLTVVIIVLVMGAWDFVYGVLVGILLACLSFVVDAARRPIVLGVYTGVVARLTVLRHPKQQDFLKDVGDQICVVKLQGPVFFGLIGGAEAAIRAQFDEEKQLTPIKFLILDMKGVSSIDFSAAEGFRRVLNLADEKGTQLIISLVSDNGEIVTALKDAGLWGGSHALPVELFLTLNYALEWCENRFLQTYRNIKKDQRLAVPMDAGGTSPVNGGSPSSRLTPNAVGSVHRASILAQALDTSYGTPRSNQILQAATRTATDEQRIQSRYFSHSDSSFKKQPLPLIMTTFLGLSTKNEVFWLKAVEFFTKEAIPSGTTFYNTSKGHPLFFLVESGLIRLVVKFQNGRELHALILPLTAFGDFQDLLAHLTVIYSTVNDLVVWRITEDGLHNLAKKSGGQEMVNELLHIQNKLAKERFDLFTANLVISA